MMGDLSHRIFETMATLDLTDEEKLALTAELKHTIAEDRYPLSPRDPHPCRAYSTSSTRGRPAIPRRR
jgi:hypothetical protein